MEHASIGQPCKHAFRIVQVYRTWAGEAYAQDGSVITGTVGVITHLIVSSAKEEAIKPKEAAHEGCVSC